MGQVLIPDTIRVFLTVISWWGRGSPLPPPPPHRTHLDAWSARHEYDAGPEPGAAYCHVAATVAASAVAVAGTLTVRLAAGCGAAGVHRSLHASMYQGCQETEVAVACQEAAVRNAGGGEHPSGIR